MEYEDKDRIQNNIGHSSQQHGHHADAAKSLGIDKAVHSQSRHDKQASQQIDGHILIRIGICIVAGAEQVEHGPLQSNAQHRQTDAEDHHHSKGVSHDLLRLVHVSPAPLNGTEGSPAHSKQVGEGRNHGNNGETQSHPRQGQTPCSGNPAYIDAVHHIVQHIDQLSQRHGHCQVDNIPDNAPFGKIILIRSHFHPPFCRNRRILSQ